MKQVRKKSCLASFVRRWWLVVPALLLYGYNAYELNFIQDDAYISYRYVANFLNGDGLVFNIGQRVEGITNQGWVVIMILLGRSGLDYIFWSQIIGLLCGAGVISVTFVTARRLFGNTSLTAASAALLVAINPSLAYWSPAGLETGLFAFLAMLSLYFYLQRNWLLIATLALAVWVRPDGALLTGLLILVETVARRSWPRFTLTAAGIAFILSLPFVVFKLSYYGSIAPNPFFAKTSFDWLQLMNGLEYTGRYLSHYGFYGLGLLVPLFFWNKLSSDCRSIWLFTFGWILYVLLIGGDVLKVHRFYLPLFGSAAMMAVLGLKLLIEKAKLKRRELAVMVAVLPLLVLTFWLPRDFVTTYNRIERNFTHKMRFYAQQLKTWDNSDFTVAIPTIGVFGYELIGHNIIDMLGLTDSTIARSSEEPIPGMQTTWKEQNHNSRYILEREPDYIIFSTGIKPSAPAERALLLYTQFLQSYRSIGWFYPIQGQPGQGRITNAFKKVRPLIGSIEPVYPVEYVQNYKRGLDAMSRGNNKEALRYYNKAVKLSPKPYHPDLLYQKASVHIQLKHDKIVWPLLKMILKQDSMVFEAHKDLYSYTTLTGDTATAGIHKRWLMRLVPWYFPRLDSLTQRKLNLLKSQTARPSNN